MVETLGIAVINPFSNLSRSEYEIHELHTKKCTPKYINTII